MRLRSSDDIGNLVLFSVTQEETRDHSEKLGSALLACPFLGDCFQLLLHTSACSKARLHLDLLKG